MRRVVLVTRPEPGLRETMRAVAELGWEPLAAPLMRIEPLAPAIPKSVRAVLLTSGQAVAPLAASAPWLLDTPVLAVGDATAERARGQGFRQVRSANGDAARLAVLAQTLLRPTETPLLLACGRGQATMLASTLRQGGFAVHRRCVYRSLPTQALVPDALDAMRRNTMRAALFFSADTAGIFRRLLPRGAWPALHNVEALVISRKAADVLSGIEWRAVRVAAEPNATSLLSLLPSDGLR